MDIVKPVLNIIACVLDIIKAMLELDIIKRKIAM